MFCVSVKLYFFNTKEKSSLGVFKDIMLTGIYIQIKLLIYVSPKTTIFRVRFQVLTVASMKMIDYSSLFQRDYMALYSSVHLHTIFHAITATCSTHIVTIRPCSMVKQFQS